MILFVVVKERDEEDEEHLLLLLFYRVCKLARWIDDRITATDTLSTHDTSIPSPDSSSPQSALIYAPPEEEDEDEYDSTSCALRILNHNFLLVSYVYMIYMPLSYLHSSLVHLLIIQGNLLTLHIHSHSLSSSSSSQLYSGSFGLKYASLSLIPMTTTTEEKMKKRMKRMKKD